MPSSADLLLATYYALLGLLAIFGAHRALLLVLFYRHRRAPSRPPLPDSLPVVTVQLPLYNEMYVGPRLLDAVCRLDYPRELLQIQVLDDSDDETTELLRERVRSWRSKGFDVRHIRRARRAGFKAGALEAGLKTARGELLAVFDADFVPPPDFLQRTVPWFNSGDVAMVQARWDHLNRQFSLLTRIQAVLLDGHFRIEHEARFASGRFFNFNGTAGIWRRRAIEDAGGWQHDTLTEDLDLSYRAQLKGWRFVYLGDLGVPAELPVDIAAFKTQQYRWAKGAIQTARKLLGPILRSRNPWWRKLEAALHLTNNCSYPLMVALSILIFPAMLLRRGSDQWSLLLVDFPLFMVATVTVVAYYLVGQTVADDRDSSPLRLMPIVLALGIGLSVNNARAALSGLVSMGGVFERTPKYRIEHRGDGWKAKRYRAGINGAFLFEGLLAAYFLFAIAVSVSLGLWVALPFLYLFLQGYGYVFLLSLKALLRQRHSPELMPSAV